MILLVLMSLYLGARSNNCPTIDSTYLITIHYYHTQTSEPTTITLMTPINNDIAIDSIESFESFLPLIQNSYRTVNYLDLMASMVNLFYPDSSRLLKADVYESNMMLWSKISYIPTKISIGKEKSIIVSIDKLTAETKKCTKGKYPFIIGRILKIVPITFYNKSAPQSLTNTDILLLEAALCRNDITTNSVTYFETVTAGRVWVGPNYTEHRSKGKLRLCSSDQKRQVQIYFQSTSQYSQADFESRQHKTDQWTNNAHIENIVKW